MLRARVADTATIPPKLEPTREGFLICHDVPLARTGEQTYLSYELPDIPALGGQIIAIRDDDEVFAPEAIKSCRGKHFTDDHPDADVDTTNWRTLSQGTVMNPHRGEGDLSHTLLGDIIVYDPKTIDRIKAGKREVSVGYDADYEIIAPGRARQVNIRINHVSLVDEGRCGPTCAIRDRSLHMADTAKKPSWKDRLFAALRSKDEAEREELLKGVEEEMPDDDHSHEGDGHHITLNLNGLPEKDRPDEKLRTESTVDEEGETETTEKTDMDEDKVKEICTAAITEALSPVMERLEAMAPKLDATVEKVEDIVEAVEDMADPEDMATQDAVARIGILAPGLARPTTDAKPGSKSHRDALGSWKKDALRAALTNDATRPYVAAVLGHAQPQRVAALTAAEANIAVRAASQMIFDRNAERTVDTLQSATSGFVKDDKGQRRPITVADLSAKAAAFYKRG